MYSLRPHRKFDFVRLWKYGFRLSGVLIALALVGFIVSTVMTGAPLTLGTEFSGGTSIQISNAGDITEDELKGAFASAAGELGYDTQISSIQTANDMSGGHGYIVKTTDTVSTNASEIMGHVENALGIDEGSVEIETIGASWGASVIWSSVLAFFLSCLGILAVIALRYREPRMGVVALVCLFHDMIVVLGIYAWAGLFFHMEITSDVIAALLAIIGYSLYDTVVVFHRINRNASPQMKCSFTTCANASLNEVIVRTLNTSITSIIPIVFMLILGTDTLIDFAFAMFCGMVVGVYSTLAISAPIYTKWKAKDPAYARLEKKYPYEVVQSPFTKQMMLEARKDFAAKHKEAKAEYKRVKLAEKETEHRIKEEARIAEKDAKDGGASTPEEIKIEEHEDIAGLARELEEAKREEVDEIAQPVDLGAPEADDAVDVIDAPEDASAADVASADDEPADSPARHATPADAHDTGAGADADAKGEPDAGDADASRAPAAKRESHRAGRYSAGKVDSDADVHTTTSTSFSYGFVLGDDEDRPGES